MLIQRESSDGELELMLLSLREVGKQGGLLET